MSCVGRLSMETYRWAQRSEESRGRVRRGWVVCGGAEGDWYEGAYEDSLGGERERGKEDRGP